MLKDVNVIGTIKHFTPEIYLIFSHYNTKILNQHKKGHNNERHLKLELPNLYKFLDETGILKGFDIIEKEEEVDIDEEIRAASPKMKRHSPVKFPCAPSRLIMVKKGQIYFPSSLMRKP